MAINSSWSSFHFQDRSISKVDYNKAWDYNLARHNSRPTLDASCLTRILYKCNVYPKHVEDNQNSNIEAQL